MNPGAQSIVDITACPGTDTCKLGISSSRGLASELRQRLAVKGWQYDEAIQNLRIKASGCFNSCSQHTTAEIGFYGSSRLVDRHRGAPLSPNPRGGSGTITPPNTVNPWA